MPSDSLPGLNQPPSKPWSDAELRRVLSLLEQGFQKIVVAHPSGAVIWTTESASRHATLASETPGSHSQEPVPPSFLEPLKRPPDETDGAFFTQLVSHPLTAPAPVRPGVRKQGPAYATFRVRLRSGQALVIGVASRSDNVITPGHPNGSGTLALSRFFDTWQSGILALDGLGGVSYANQAAARLLQTGRTELVRQPIAFLASLSGELAKSLIELPALEPETETGALQTPIQIEHPDGQASYLQVEIQTVADQQLAVLHDVTAQVAMQRSLERKNNELEGYVQGVSHDLRSPLVSLLGFSRLLRQDYGDRLEETGRHFTDRIEQAADTMRALLDDLLEISRSEGHREPRSMTDPRPILRQLKAELKLRLEEVDAVLAIPLAPPWVYSDRARLYQIFSNLVVNALQHMGECTNRTIDVGIEEQENGTLISVADHGQGISPEELDLVFQPFYSRGQSRRVGSTKGVGLNIVRKIAESHGGRAWAENRASGGVRFQVFLPHSN